MRCVPRYIIDLFRGYYFTCGFCEFEIGEEEEYCPVCGCKINWEAVECE